MPTYKTKDGVDRLIPGVGRTIDGQITTDAKIENPMFEIIGEGEAPAQVAQATAPSAAPAAAPAQPIPAAPIASSTPATLEQIQQNINKLPNGEEQA